MQGFINNIENNDHTERHYWSFFDATILNIDDVVENHNLGFDSNYNTLLSNYQANIGWTVIQDAFFQLTNVGTNRPPITQIIKGSLARVILATAESMRFRQVRDNIIENYDTQSTSSVWGHYRNIITNWGSITQNAINYLSENGNLNNFVNIGRILIFSMAMYNELNNCGNINKLNKRSLKIETCIEENTIYWNNLYHLNLSGWGNKKITLPNNVKATAIKVLQKDSVSRGLSSGDTYFATTNGVYLKHGEGQIDKFDGLDFLITDIELDNKGSTYVINNKGEVYHLNLSGWGNEKITLPNNVKATAIKVLQKDSSENNNLKAGSIYVGTTNGIYFKSYNENDNNNIMNYKFDGLDFLITDIELDNKGSAYIFIE